MTGSRDTICFTCGLAVQAPPRFNLLSSGEYCPTCRDRVLDAVPALLPRSAAGREGALVESQMDFAFEDSEEPSGYPDPPLSA